MGKQKQHFDTNREAQEYIDAQHERGIHVDGPFGTNPDDIDPDGGDGWDTYTEEL